MNKNTLASVLGLLFFSPAISSAAADISFDDVIVSATRIEHKDTETTYASEIHTADMIRSSGASTLYDYFSQQTSLNILPNFGNKATPSIDMRGYGSENGYQNIVISVDGRRLNNIDLMPQLISAIPLGNIERIEITKGSGSVVYGDGAMAGSIQIYTKTRQGISASASVGNYGQQSSYLAAGIAERFFDLSASLAHDRHDGFSRRDETGKKDEFRSDTQNVKLKLKPVAGLRFNLEGTSSRNDIRYVNPLTKAQFEEDPRQVGDSFMGKVYTHQGFDTDQWSVGVEYDISEQLQLSATHSREDKRSEFVNFDFELDYDYEFNDIALKYSGELLTVVGGIQTFDGDRQAVGSSETTTKDNQAFFIQTEYRPTWLTDRLILSAGARNEKVEYRYHPAFGSKLKDSEHLDAWDIGANYRLSEEASVFANYNQAFQAPDIDRFFRFDFGTFQTVFNAFVQPAKARTFNLGLNHVTGRNRFKISAFHADLDDEIYFNPLTFENTNIDSSHKYGLELQDHLKLNDRTSAGIIYTYTRAIIDREDSAGVSIRNKNLPGVPRHTVAANLNYRFLDRGNINLSQNWRDSTYVLNDFSNNASQKQKRYASTNLVVSYGYKKVEWFASVNNIFEHENTLQVADDAIYPVDFVRTWRVGMRADF